jgi:hypothetical protein
VCRVSAILEIHRRLNLHLYRVNVAVKVHYYQVNRKQVQNGLKKGLREEVEQPRDSSEGVNEDIVTALIIK